MTNMNISGKIKIKYKDIESAEISHESLKVDNKGFVNSEINNDTTIYTIKSKSLGSFLATCDDLIASHILIEKILNTSKNKEGLKWNLN